MALYEYTAVDKDGSQRQGTVDAVTVDIAIAALQRRGLVIVRIDEAKAKGSIGNINISGLFSRISNADIVMLSKQIATLFEAQVSALRAFRLLAAEARTQKLAEKLTEVGNDIQSGSAISAALSRHPDVFSSFYVNMVRAGEESGKLDETFNFLAGYLDRNYAITQKARNALIYPAFVMFTFVVVMILMMTMVVPNISSMLSEAGQNIPLTTRIVIGMSDFFTKYIVLIGILFVIAAVFLYRYAQTETGRMVVARARLQAPAIGPIYQKIFLARIADNLATMLKSGIQVLRGLEITGQVVGDPIYEQIMTDTAADVKGGMPLSEAFRKHPEIPGILIAMIKIGEETGNMGKILDTIAGFYRREVDGAVDTLVGLIEPIMIVVLAVGVAILLASVLMPIYNLASSF